MLTIFSASANARWLTSSIVTLWCGQTFAMVRPIGPYPHPTSTIDLLGPGGCSFKNV